MEPEEQGPQGHLDADEPKRLTGQAGFEPDQDSNPGPKGGRPGQNSAPGATGPSGGIPSLPQTEIPWPENPVIFLWPGEPLDPMVFDRSKLVALPQSFVLKKSAAPRGFSLTGSFECVDGRWQMKVCKFKGKTPVLTVLLHEEVDEIMLYALRLLVELKIAQIYRYCKWRRPQFELHELKIAPLNDTLRGRELGTNNTLPENWDDSDDSPDDGELLKLHSIDNQVISLNAEMVKMSPVLQGLIDDLQKTDPTPVPFSDSVLRKVFGGLANDGLDESELMQCIKAADYLGMPQVQTFCQNLAKRIKRSHF